MPDNRLSQLEKNLKRLREQLYGFEDALITAPQEEKTRLRQRIRDKREEILPFEEEYWQIVAQGAADIDVLEAEAEVIVAEIVEQYPQSQGTENPEVFALLQNIYAKVNKPGATAAGKLKGVTYEAELDTETTLRKYVPSLINWARQVVGQLKKKF